MSQYVAGVTSQLSEASLDRLLARVQSYGSIGPGGRRFVEVRWTEFDGTESLTIYYQDDLEAEKVWRKGGVPKPSVAQGSAAAIAAGAMANQLTIAGAAMSTLASAKTIPSIAPPKATGGLRMPPYEPERDEHGFPVPQPVHEHAEVTQWLQAWKKAAGNYGAIVAEMIADWETRNPG